MRHHNWIVKGFQIALVLIIVIAGFGQAVLQLWNWLVPDLFGLSRLTFWQAVGLMSLSWLLFGGFRGMMGFGGHRHCRERMTPEERERFRKGLEAQRGRCVEPQS